MKKFAYTAAAFLGLTAALSSVAQAQHVADISELPEKPEPAAKKHLPADWVILTLAGEAAALADVDATLNLRHNYPNFVESDPLARPFVRLPAPAYITVAVAFTAALSIASLKMNRSSNKWVRRFWWVPQTVQIGLSAKSAEQTASWPAPIAAAQKRRR